jgi:hypothetical protein
MRICLSPTHRRDKHNFISSLDDGLGLNKRLIDPIARLVLPAGQLGLLLNQELLYLLHRSARRNRQSQLTLVEGFAVGCE